jgi:hypothetical protein
LLPPNCFHQDFQWLPHYQTQWPIFNLGLKPISSILHSWSLPLLSCALSVWPPGHHFSSHWWLLYSLHWVVESPRTHSWSSFSYTSFKVHLYVLIVCYKCFIYMCWPQNLHFKLRFFSPLTPDSHVHCISTWISNRCLEFNIYQNEHQIPPTQKYLSSHNLLLPLRFSDQKLYSVLLTPFSHTIFSICQKIFLNFFFKMCLDSVFHHLRYYHFVQSAIISHFLSQKPFSFVFPAVLIPPMSIFSTSTECIFKKF